ncbi:MAG TPA: GAF domain-containing SpoIIE family protein phosphatase [Gemmatimonadaceae bacterium]|nr:GAF domain-containing SpoIIE family protein phosphatase [Gemmatimonadaceae bacterium]
MSDLLRVLGAFRRATGCDAIVWQEDGERLRRQVASAGPGLRDWTPPRMSGPPLTVDSPGGPALIAAIPGPHRRWLSIGPCSSPATSLADLLDLLLPIVTLQLQASLEVEHAATELAERYEEINLLYTITEILGRSVALEEVAATILHEVCETVGAARGSLLVFDAAARVLHAVAAQGVEARTLPMIDEDDACSVSARVFREQRAVIVDEHAMWCDAEAPYRRGTMLSVPIMWTAPGGSPEPLGVVNLSDRTTQQPFSAGDQKLVAAIATQIGTAIQNARLVTESLERQQFLREMELAHDLQMKLLPRADVVAPDATVAARVVSAESVGGDFYQLFPLGNGRTGIMVADVSSHGYGAALIMALAMSASAIHAQGSPGPAAMLESLLESLQEELAKTEMSISAFYGVIDRAAGTLAYANAGLPHAFLVPADGEPERLGAIDPPLGLGADVVHERVRSWSPGDLLLLFTDGLSDARGSHGARFGEQRVLDAVRPRRAAPPAEILAGVFEAVALHTGGLDVPDDQTCVLVRS